ncbi:alpha/beta fold hydrolase [Flavobacteriaceae bacterium M23B6Z8]
MFKKILKWIVGIVMIAVLLVLIYGSVKQYNYDTKVRKEYQPTGKFSDIGDTKIHYEYTGEGDVTFVLIAGMGESTHTWSSIVSELEKKGRVFRYDRSGLGFSGAPVLPKTVGNAAEELHKVLEKENIKGPYVLVGHSAGGFIARYYAKKYPELVMGLFLIDPYQEMARAEAGPSPLSYRLMNWSFRRMSWSGIPFFLLPKPPHPIYKTSKAIETYGWEANAEKESLEQFEALDKTPSDLPLYLLKADNQRKKYNEMQIKWSKQIFAKYKNDINKYLLLESGHHIHIEKPKEVLGALDEFLTKLTYESEENKSTE